MRLRERVPPGVLRCQACLLATEHLHRQGSVDAYATSDRWLCDVCYLLGGLAAVPTVPTQEPEREPMTTAEQLTDYVAKSDADQDALAKLGEARQYAARAQEMLALAQQASDQAAVACSVAWHDLVKLVPETLVPGVYLLDGERALAITGSLEAPRPAPVRKLA